MPPSPFDCGERLEAGGGSRVHERGEQAVRTRGYEQ